MIDTSSYDALPAIICIVLVFGALAAVWLHYKYLFHGRR